MYGRKIRQLRKNAGLKQVDLAQMVGVSRPNISFWENADYPPLEAIDKICKALGLEIWKFFGDDFVETQTGNLPAKYSNLLKELSKLGKEEYNDLLEIIAIYLRKNNKASLLHELTSDGGAGTLKDNEFNNAPRNPLQYQTINIEIDYSLPFNADSIIHNAIINYTERFLRMM